MRDRCRQTETERAREQERLRDGARECLSLGEQGTFPSFRCRGQEKKTTQETAVGRLLLLLYFVFEERENAASLRAPAALSLTSRKEHCCSTPPVPAEFPTER